MTRFQKFMSGFLVMLLAMIATTSLLDLFATDDVRLSEIREKVEEQAEKPEKPKEEKAVRDMKMAVRFEKKQPPEEEKPERTAPEQTKERAPRQVAKKPQEPPVKAVPKTESAKPVRVASVPKPKASVPKRPEPVEYAYAKKLTMKGKRLIGTKGQKIGAFPAITIDNEKHLSTREYVQAMLGIGARFTVLEVNSRRFAGDIDFRHERLVPFKGLDGMSPKTRFVKGEAHDSMDRYIRQARDRRGGGKYVIALLLPLEIDHYVAGAIADALVRKGIATNDVSELSGCYRKDDGTISMEIETVHIKGGNTLPINIRLRLGA